MSDTNDNRKMEKLELLLRRQAPLELGADFRRQVMAEVKRLPAPALLARPRGLAGLWDTARRLGTGEKLALGVGLLGVAALMLPGADSVLAGWNFELADTTFSLSVGDLALSASALSVAFVGLGVAFLTAVGAYSARQHLLGA